MSQLAGLVTKTQQDAEPKKRSSEVEGGSGGGGDFPQYGEVPFSVSLYSVEFVSTFLFAMCVKGWDNVSSLVADSMSSCEGCQCHNPSGFVKDSVSKGSVSQGSNGPSAA